MLSPSSFLRRLICSAFVLLFALGVPARDGVMEASASSIVGLEGPDTRDAAGDDDDSASGDDDDSASADDDSAAEEEPSPLQPPYALPPEFPPLSAFLAQAEAETGAPLPPERADFSILYEGETHGISGAGPDLWAVDTVHRALTESDPKWALGHSGFGAALKDGSWLLQREGAVAGLREMAKAGLEPGQEEARPTPVLISDDSLIVVWPPEEAQALLPALKASFASEPMHSEPVQREFTGRLHGSPAGPVLHLGRKGNLRGEEKPFSPLEWELRLQSIYVHPDRDAVVHIVSRLSGEGTRRAALAAKWRRSPSLYLSAGESVEGQSFLAKGGLSLTRPITWELWSFLGLTALAPGAKELIGGIETLRQEAEAAGTVLLSANLLDSRGEPVFTPISYVQIAGQDVALIGWTDPSVLDQLSPQIRQGLQVRGVESLQALLPTLATPKGQDPDLVVVVGRGAETVAGSLPGVDLVLGDFGTNLRVPRWEEVGEAALRVRAIEDKRTRAPALITRSGPDYIGRIDLGFDPETGTMRRLRHLRAHLGEDLPASPKWVRAIQTVRQEVYASLEDVLIPDLRSLKLPEPEDKPATLSAQALARVASNMLVDRTGSDVSLLRPLPQPIPSAGATRELSVDASLSVADEIVVFELTGVQTKALLDRISPYSPDPESNASRPDGVKGSWAWAAGLQKQGRKLLFRGRSLADDDRIRLVTTTFIADDPRVSALVKGAVRWDRFIGRGWQRIPTHHRDPARPWSLHDLVKDGLKQLRDADPKFGATYTKRLTPLLRDLRTKAGPRFLLELDGISLQITGSVPVGNRAGYESSRESRVQQEESFSTSLRGRVAGTFEDRIGSLHGEVSWAFGRSKLAEVDEPTELDDDFQAGVEGRLKVVRVPVFGRDVPLSAFVQAVFDTEFTPGEDETSDQKLPLQRILRSTTGVNLSKLLVFKQLKFGFFVEYDLSAEVGPVSPGFSFAGTTEKRWGPVRWANKIEFKGYLPTEADTEEDLAATLHLRSDLGIVPLKKLIPGLSLGGFIDALVFGGTTEVNRHPGLHLLMGAALTYDSDLRPPIRLR